MIPIAIPEDSNAIGAQQPGCHVVGDIGDEHDSGYHVMWADLIAPEGFELQHSGNQRHEAVELSGGTKWFGDYRFGTFISDGSRSWRRRYFVPWSVTVTWDLRPHTEADERQLLRHF